MSTAHRSEGDNCMSGTRGRNKDRRSVVHPNTLYFEHDKLSCPDNLILASVHPLSAGEQQLPARHLTSGATEMRADEGPSCQAHPAARCPANWVTEYRKWSCSSSFSFIRLLSFTSTLIPKCFCAQCSNNVREASDYLPWEQFSLFSLSLVIISLLFLQIIKGKCSPLI